MSSFDYSEKPTERSRWTPLTRMLLSGEMTQEKQKELTAREKFDRWMINEGYRRLCVPHPISKCVSCYGGSEMY